MSYEKEREILSRIANKKNLTLAEYLYTSHFVRDKPTLIFGAYMSEIYWNELSPHCTFLEDRVTVVHPNNQNVKPIKYTCKFETNHYAIDAFLKEGCTSRLITQIPKPVINTNWATIIVEGPGSYPGLPGRLQSIYMAYQLANKDTDVFIANIDGTVENRWSKVLFGTHIRDIDFLRHMRK